MNPSSRSEKALTAAEWKRKAVHAGMGLFALLLRWLDWKTAALSALGALLFSLLAMPRIGRGIYRDPTRRRDPGIVAYPAMVLLSIVLFRSEPALAAALWGMIALGDPAATVAGRLLEGPTLPWNPKKRWSGLAAYAIAGGAAAAALWAWVSPEAPTPSELLRTLLPAAVLGAFLESLETGLDDNWIPPLPCALLLAYERAAMSDPALWLPSARWALAIAVNGVLGYVTFWLHIVERSGAVAGSIVGFAILAFGGWGHYAVLWTFFLLATMATRLGYGRKESIGTAQSGKGRRGGRHAIANCGVPAVLCLLGAAGGPEWAAWMSVGFAGAFAAALADTLGTELGGLYGRRPVSPLTARVVPPGTRGAVSWAGLAGCAAGALAIATIAALVSVVSWSLLWIVAVAGVVGSLAESVLADATRLRGGRLDHEFANAFNTFMGAVGALEIAASVGAGRLRIPFEWGRT